MKECLERFFCMAMSEHEVKSEKPAQLVNHHFLSSNGCLKNWCLLVYILSIHTYIRTYFIHILKTHIFHTQYRLKCFSKIILCATSYQNAKYRMTDPKIFACYKCCVKKNSIYTFWQFKRVIERGHV